VGRGTRTTGRDEMAAKTDDGDREPAGLETESGTGLSAADDDQGPELHTYQPTGGGRAVAELSPRTSSASKPGWGHATVPLPVQRPIDDDTPPAGARVAKRRRWIPFAATSRKVFWLAVIAGIVAVLLLVTNLFGLWPKLGNPFGSQRTDRSGPVLLLSIQDLSRFEAASGNFQVIVDLQNDRKFIPDFLFNQRSLFVADGSVDAYVDFGNISQGDIKLDPTNAKKVTINLPAPQLEPPNLDLGRSYLYATQQGLINRLTDIFANHANSEQQLYQLGQQKIAAAALDSQLPQRAEQNTRSMLTGMLRSLGFTSVTINFASS
jgi:hypothetical protein